ncbi:tyrosine-type recombinase/integrase [Gemmobacter caeruleus]|uniref:tyrosine-type recombinase/integrase n=1 Tax=Gemmobacter caeruleus TaxID=2595004 RepID=UPI0011ED4BC4|nr:integrase arm-type DNA-binding domain-containing protein [Gemmobacter caeruleus]
MPRIAKELGPLDIKRAVHGGGRGNDFLPVGGVPGLLLQVTPTGGKTWVLRITIAGKRAEIGLGGYPTVTLAQARDKAREARDQISRGVDPRAERRAARAALALAANRSMTFAEAMDKFLDAKLDAFRNEKHKAQWRSTLKAYALPQIGALAVSDIDTAAVLRVLQPIWATKTETASRLRGRIEAVLSWATVSGYRSGDNPARWAGNLKELLPAPAKLAGGDNQPALNLDHAPAWFAELRTREGFGARALEFLTMTAARSGEVRGATWEEIDLDRALWTIPAQRMKMKREHKVPLSPAAVALLEALPRLDRNPLVFPAARGGELSDMTLSATMRRIHEAKAERDGDKETGGYRDPRNKRAAVPHGLRSTFRDWVAERTQYPGEMAEVALAHKISNAVEAAYRRGDMVEKRRRLMADWSGFLAGAEAKGNVVKLGART